MRSLGDGPTGVALTGREPSFIARRFDGLGGRLVALLNAMVLAEEFGGTFEFAWPENDDLDDGHACAPAEEIFAPAFLERFRRECWSEPDARRAARALTADHLEGREEIGFAPGECWVTGLEDYGDVLGRPWGNRRYAAAFERIDFVPAIARAIELAGTTEVQPAACALHLRGGDIVFRLRFSNQFTQRVVPFPLIAEIGRRARDTGRQVLVFGQEPEVVEHVAAATGGVSVHAMARRLGLTRLQAWFFETTLMARCATIVAGTSAFAALARRVGSAAASNGYRQVRATDALSIVMGGSVEAAPVPELHKAFAYWAVQDVYRVGLAVGDRLGCVRRALTHDPVNSFYRLAEVALLVELGNVDAARQALRSVVDAEIGQREWTVGCLRQTLVNIRRGQRPTSLQYLSGVEKLAALGMPEALLCMALVTPDRDAVAELAGRFRSAEGKTRRARFYSLALDRAASASSRNRQSARSSACSARSVRRAMSVAAARRVAADLASCRSFLRSLAIFGAR